MPREAGAWLHNRRAQRPPSDRLPTAGVLVRIRSEKDVLFAALGDDYRRYAATRRQLFPGVG